MRTRTVAAGLGFALLAALPLTVWSADTATTCQSHGTSIDFVETPKEAAALAKKAEKLVLVLHVSGNFEDPGFT